MRLRDRENGNGADRARRYVKAELKRAEVSYAELARRLKEHGLDETRNSDHREAQTRHIRSYILPGDNEGDWKGNR